MAWQLLAIFHQITLLGRACGGRRFLLVAVLDCLARLFLLALGIPLHAHSPTETSTSGLTAHTAPAPVFNVPTYDAAFSAGLTRSSTGNP